MAIIIRQCALCEYTGSSNKMLIHVKENHNLNSDQYLWKYVYKHNGEPICKICGSPIHYNEWAKDKTFCSYNCAATYNTKQKWKNSSYREMMSENMKRRWITNRDELVNKSRTYKHGLSHSRLDRILNGMIMRCHNPNRKEYKNYGGRGITVCDEWRTNRQSFYEWALNNGYSDVLTINRIDNNKGYCPENCKWVTMEVQRRNKRTNVLLTLNGKTKIMADFAREYGLNPDTVQRRLKLGWSTEKALLTPVIKRKIEPTVDIYERDCKGGKE